MLSGRELDMPQTLLRRRPQYHWGSNVIKAYWVFFKTEQDRRRAIDMTGRHLVNLFFLLDTLLFPYNMQS